MPIPWSLWVSISTQSFVSQLCTVFEIRELKLKKKKKNNNNKEKMKNSENANFNNFPVVQFWSYFEEPQIECLLPRKRGFSECMGVMLANPCHPYIQRGYSPFVLVVQLARFFYIRESVDSLCRDGADTPMPPYIGKAFTRTNFEDLSLFRYMIMVCE